MPVEKLRRLCKAIVEEDDPETLSRLIQQTRDTLTDHPELATEGWVWHARAEGTFFIWTAKPVHIIFRRLHLTVALRRFT